MHTSRRWRLAVAAALLGFVSTVGSQTMVGDEEFRSVFKAAPTLIETARECRLFELYLALESAQKNRGLMFVREMRNDQAMLFVYPPGSRISMWMKNTVIPLDIVFLDEDGVVINVAANTTPLSLVSVRAARPGAFALELNAGQAAALGLATGKQAIRPDLLSF